jgi:UDP-2-acetamido-2-deoxy-ribo-hexuluronate aminotransferase
LIPFIDLGTQYKLIQHEVEAAVLRVLRSGQYIMGPEVDSLEQELADFVGVRHAVSCASGTDALVMALMAKGVGPGDAVFTTPFTFMASAEAISLVGATPVFVDVDPRTFNMDPDALREVIGALLSGRASAAPLPQVARDQLIPRGIIAVDLFGLPSDYAAIEQVATDHDLFVIEDAAQSFGATLGNRRAGALASIGATSFFPAKPLGCYGDGGALFSDDDELADVIRSIRVHGQGADRYEHVRIGLTGRLDAVQAAILSVKLRILPEELDRRESVAANYNRAIQEAALPLETPKVPDGYTSAWAQYSVLAESADGRAAYQAKLAAAQIPTGIYYPKPLHLQGAFAPLGYSSGDFPVSESLSQRIFSLPMHPYLSDEDIHAIVGAMQS